MIVLHLPFPPSVNEANKFSKRGYYPSNAKRDFFRDADALFLTQKRALSGLKVDGPFTYHVVLSRAQRGPLADGDNRLKYPLDYAQRVGLIDNDKFAEGGSWSWGECEHGAMLSIHPVQAGKYGEAGNGATKAGDGRGAAAPEEPLLLLQSAADV
jgi:hypothetical protein